MFWYKDGEIFDRFNTNKDNFIPTNKYDCLKQYEYECIKVLVYYLAVMTRFW